MSVWPDRDTGMAASTGEATRTPIYILSAVAILLVLFIIFAPQQSSEVGTIYSSYTIGAGGTRALYDVLHRVGFTMSRGEKSLATRPDTTSTYVFFNPAQSLTSSEQAQLLDAVRRGTILVFTLDDEALADSLGFKLASPPNGFHTLNRTTVAGGNPPARLDQDPRAVFQAAFPISVTVASKTKDSNEVFLWLQPGKGSKAAQRDSAQQPALVVGHRVGRGYAIAIAPAPIVMNQLLRNPQTAIAVVRGIQFATTTLGPRPRSNNIVFDEYHHGFGVHADMVAAVEHALTDTPLGRMTIELIAAGLVLLLAFAVRPLAPVSVPPVSRRSPLEHVGALAYAYSQVDARALGANRLVRGLRRRHPLGIPRSLPDSTYLSALRDRIPIASTDVDHVLAALEAKPPDSSHSFADTGAAIANIERTFQA